MCWKKGRIEVFEKLVWLKAQRERERPRNEEEMRKQCKYYRESELVC